MGIAGYLAFRDTTDGDILNNFSYKNDFINVARFLLALTMVFIYPMESYVCRHVIFEIFFADAPKGSWRLELAKSSRKYLLPGLSLLLWIIAVSIGANISETGVILELTGAIGASLLAYVFPCLIHLRAHGFYKLRELSKS